MTASAQPDVRAQYEAYPYPARDPADERARLVRTWLDDLPMINHYGFRGRQDFRGDFRVLVAGGGTGDGTVFLAEQLRATGAEIVHLDLSEAATAIARARAAMRGLANVRFVRGSLLDLPQLGLGRFDYINCSGVLHHLEDPDAGLRALLAVLADDGVLGVMVYGQCGRTGIYQLQALLRLLTAGLPDAAARIAAARELLACLPRTNWFKRGEELYSDHRQGDAGLYDMLLHGQDRAYSAEEIHAWFGDRHGLHVQFTDVGRGRSPYVPRLVAGPRPPGFLAAVEALPPRRQHEIAELMGGTLITHSFYATRAADTRAPYGDPDGVPFLFHEPVTGPRLAELVRQHGEKPFDIHHVHTGVSTRLDPGRHGRAILARLDGTRSFGEIFAQVREEPALRTAPPTDAAFFADFAPLFDYLTAIDRLLLRHRSVAPLAAVPA